MCFVLKIGQLFPKILKCIFHLKSAHFSGQYVYSLYNDVHLFLCERGLELRIRLKWGAEEQSLTLVAPNLTGPLSLSKIC